MGRFVPLVFGALSALHVLGAIAQNTANCLPQCTNQLRGQFAKFSCGSAADIPCLCAKPDFANGIRDCGAPCGATDSIVHDFLATNLCAGLMSTAATSATTSAATTSSTVKATTSSSRPAEAAIATSSTSSSTSVAPTTTQNTSSTTPRASSSTTTGSTSTSCTSATPSTTSGIPASATSSQAAVAAAAGGASGNGLSQAAVIGIGVGIGVAVIAITGIVIGLLLRNRSRTPPRQSMEISKPLPGSGRGYLPRDHGSFEKYGDDIEMTSNRYEDMVPRTLPRTML
ncbi:Uncharacterized protein TCAP_00514 [Tolypocladium capitatum]|uniref:CFEM domain-containing protein n=1 Tax=Tolypocladium capitatum TaxID=45235 RepID=A0A2K3QPX8_9HYPO|nr:Uncharacterized protein TCAP_00514 [Tolypocladium capitatum]